MKNFIKNIIIIILFLLVIIMPTLLWGILNLVYSNNEEFMSKIDFDLGEKRNKATMSEIINLKTLNVELENYYNDRIPFRSMLINWKNSVESFIEKPYENIEKTLLSFMGSKTKKNAKYQAEEIDGVVSLYMDEAVDIFLNHGLKDDEIDPYIEGIDFPIKYLSKDVILGQSNWMYLNFGNIDYYTGKENIKEEDIDNYVAPYEAIEELCDYYGKEFLMVVCPEKEEIYPEYMPTMEIIDEVEKPIKIRDYIATNSTVTYLYPKEELIDLKSKYRLYMKYDSHWSDVGGYIVANEIKEELGMETTPLRDLKVTKIDEINKDLVFFAGADRANYADGFEYIIDYKPEVLIHINFQDDPIRNTLVQTEVLRDISTKSEIATKSNIATSSELKDFSDKELLVIGDSFRNSIVKFLARDFAKVTSATFENIEEPMVEQAIKDADIIIFEAVERNEAIIFSTMCNKVYRTLTK